MDHQHGSVTGFAINKGVDLWFNVREDAHVHLASRTFEGEVDFELDVPTQVKEHHWGDYARGAKYALRKRFELKRGVDGVIQGSSACGWIVVERCSADCLCDGICEGERNHIAAD